MRTIGTRWSRAVRNDWQACCSICGVPWPRSKLRKRRDGTFTCPDEGDGMTVLELELEAAQNARSVAPRVPPMDHSVQDPTPEVE